MPLDSKVGTFLLTHSSKVSCGDRHHNLLVASGTWNFLTCGRLLHPWVRLAVAYTSSSSTCMADTITSLGCSLESSSARSHLSRVRVHVCGGRMD